jgi:hypothetical protein
MTCRARNAISGLKGVNDGKNKLNEHIKNKTFPNGFYDRGVEEYNYMYSPGRSL